MANYPAIVSQRACTIDVSRPEGDFTGTLDVYQNAYGGYTAASNGYPYVITVRNGQGKVVVSDITGYDFAGWYTYSGTYSDTFDWTGKLIDYATNLLSTNTKIDFTTIYNGAGQFNARNGNVYYVVFPKWTPKDGLLTYDANGGEVTPTTKTVPVGEAIGALPTPTRTGYTFLGWYTAASGGSVVLATKTMPTTATLTIYAHWVAERKLYFAPMGGECQEKVRIVDEGQKYGTLPTPTWTGHQFLGWFTEPYSGTQVNQNTVMGGIDTGVYAHWSISTIQVIFSGNGGTPDSQTVDYISGSRFGSFPSVSWSGHIVLGWYTSAESGTKVSPSDTVFATTLYAQWRVSSGGSASGEIWM